MNGADRHHAARHDRVDYANFNAVLGPGIGYSNGRAALGGAPADSDRR
jgi:hypothetical protein